MRILASILFLSLMPSAIAAGIEPGTILWISAAISPGAGEAHPAIILKSGETCDLLSLVCLARAKRDFGDKVLAQRDAAIQQLLDRLGEEPK